MWFIKKASISGIILSDSGLSSAAAAFAWVCARAAASAAMAVLSSQLLFASAASSVLGARMGSVCVCVCVWERERKRVRWRDGERERRLTSSSSLTSSAEALNLYLLYTERRKQRYSESPEPRRSLEDGDEGYICCSTSRTVSIILNCINTIVYSTSLRLLLYKVLHALTNQYLRSRM